MKLFIITLLVSLCVGCSSQQQETAKGTYLSQVGDIPFDPDIDDPKFEVCNEERTLQYYVTGNSLNYDGEKIALIEKFKSEYDLSVSKESGYITIRFIVNCEGKSGRFRVISMDSAYNEIEFHEQITDQLLATTKKLDGWKTLSGGGNSFDYYQYLT